MMMDACMNVCERMHMHACTYVCMYVCVHVHEYVYEYVDVDVYIRGSYPTHFYANYLNCLYNRS